MNITKKWITVPRNDEGINVCENGDDIQNDNIICAGISQERLDEIFETGIINKINMVCDLLIDDYESERIEGDNIEKCLEIVNGEFDELEEALRQAKQYGTFVDLDF